MPDVAPFSPRVAAASLSGQSDAEWARATAPHVGTAFLGGIALDEPTREAARELVERDREEFLPDDPLGWIDRQFDALADVPIRPAVNVRAAEPRPVGEAAAICAARDAILEVNAHCRQPELCAAGTGQALLREPERLAADVEAAAEPGVTVSVKVRTEVDGVDLPAVAARAVAAGADVVHVDAMDSESVVADVVDAFATSSGDATAGTASGPFVIANNEVRDRESVREYLGYGADAVSVGRPSTEPAALERVLEATQSWFGAERPAP